MLAERYGGKWVFIIFYLISTVATMLTPLAARLHYAAVILMRVLVGIGSVSTRKIILTNAAVAKSSRYENYVGEGKRKIAIFFFPVIPGNQCLLGTSDWTMIGACEIPTTLSSTQELEECTCQLHHLYCNYHIHHISHPRYSYIQILLYCLR